MNWLSRFFSTDPGAPSLLDHLPISGDFIDADGNACSTEKAKAVGEGLSHKEKLALAAKRHADAFKCAGDSLPRKVIKGGVDVVVGTASVTRLPARKT